MIYTIITVVRNSREQIRSTIESVLNQSCCSLEYIIVDGKSTDDTYDIVNSYDAEFKKKGIAYKHISESDSGIYDAMNKGTNMATGMWINYMNAGDTFADNKVLEDVYIEIVKNTAADVIYGDTIEVYDDGDVLSKAKDINTIVKHLPFGHQACFLKREILKKNLYDLDYRIVADYELMLRLYLQGYTFCQINRVICRYRTDGISRKNRYNTYKEDVLVKSRYGLIASHSPKQKLIDLYYKNLFEEGSAFHVIAERIQSFRKR